MTSNSAVFMAVPLNRHRNAFTPGDLALGLHINQLEAIAAAVTVTLWPPADDTHVDLCVDTQAVATRFGEAICDEVATHFIKIIATLPRWRRSIIKDLCRTCSGGEDLRVGA